MSKKGNELLPTFGQAVCIVHKRTRHVVEAEPIRVLEENECTVQEKWYKRAAFNCVWRWSTSPERMMSSAGIWRPSSDPSSEMEMSDIQRTSSAFGRRPLTLWTAGEGDPWTRLCVILRRRAWPWDATRIEDGAEKEGMEKQG